MNIFLGNPRLVILIMIAFAALGSKGIWHLKREYRPHVDFARASIMTVYPGSSSAEVEELITKKIEDEIRSVSHLKDVHSVSRPGLSLINIRMDIDHGDSPETLNKLSQALQKVQGLPSEVLDPPRLNHSSSSDQSLIVFYLAGPAANNAAPDSAANNAAPAHPAHDSRRLRDELAFQLKTELERLPGVSEVIMESYRKREFLVSLSPKKMRKHYISSADVIAALKQKSMDAPAGYLESPKGRSLVRILGKARSARELGETIIRSNFSGRQILVKDVASVTDGPENESRRAHFYRSGCQPDCQTGGSPYSLPDRAGGFRLLPAVSLNVKKTKEADALLTARLARAAAKKFERRLPGPPYHGAYKVRAGFSEAAAIKNRLTNVISNALTGLALIFIVFFLFLPSRTGMMAALSLPISVLGAFSVLPFFGVSFNVITMLAFVICIGMLVDNSVVISEYYSRRAMDGGIPPAQAALESVRRFWKPVTATVLTTIAAFLPMLVTAGVMGQFIKWIPIVVTTALLASLFESFCLLPSRLQWLSSNKGPSRRSRGLFAGRQFGGFSSRWLDRLRRGAGSDLFRLAEEGFEKLLRRAISSKYISLGLIGLLICATAVLFRFGVRVDLFSARSPEYYSAYLEPQPGAPLHAIDKKARQTAESMYSLIGGGEAVEWISVNSNFKSAGILLKLRPSALKRLKREETLRSFRQGIKPGSLRVLRFGIMAPGPPAGKALSIAVQSSSRRDIGKFIGEAAPDLKKIPGVLNLKSNPDPDQGIERRIHLDRKAMARLGLDFRSAGLAVRTALEGHLVSELTENSESFYIRVRQDQSQMSSIPDLKKIRLRERMGRLIPLSEAAEIKTVRSEPDRRAYNFEPVVFLEADIDGKITTSMEAGRRARSILEEKAKSHPSVSFKMIGEQEAISESLESLRRASLTAFFLILVMLVVLFKSFWLSFLVLTCVPLGMIGVVWAFFAHQRDLNFFALIGVVGLAGVVVNSAIILVSYVLRLREEKPEAPLSDIALSAAKARFRPIMITNLTTLGGLFPTAYGLAGFEPLLAPMTLSLFWGLFSATALTLFWAPCAMLAFEDARRWLAGIERL